MEFSSLYPRTTLSEPSCPRLRFLSALLGLAGVDGPRRKDETCTEVQNDQKKKSSKQLLVATDDESVLAEDGEDEDDDGDDAEAE